MKLWLIKAKHQQFHDHAGKNDNPWFPEWDKYFGFVIRAESAEQARNIAADNSADEGREPWLDPELTSCDELTTDGKPSIVLSDFNAG